MWALDHAEDLDDPATDVLRDRNAVELRECLVDADPEEVGSQEREPDRGGLEIDIDQRTTGWVGSARRAIPARSFASRGGSCSGNH